MNIIIGIDGGGTKTSCIAADLNGRVLHHIYGESSNFLISGEKKSAEVLFNLISICSRGLITNYDNIQAIVIGNKGAGRKENAESLKHSLIEYAISKRIKLQNLLVISDAEIALEGALQGKPGCILIAGTGSIMYGKDVQGNIHRVGGYGKYIGDEGSGYNIGRRGLALLAKYFDGRGKETLLAKSFATQFKITSGQDLILEIYSKNFDIASAAPFVIQAAVEGDLSCMQILEEENKEMLLHIEAMSKKLESDEFYLCLIGGILENDNYFSQLFISHLNSSYPKIKVKKPDFSPEMGAILIAKKLIGGNK